MFTVPQQLRNSKTKLRYTLNKATFREMYDDISKHIEWIRVKRVLTINALNNINLSLVLITLNILNNNKIDPHGIN